VRRVRSPWLGTTPQRPVCARAPRRVLFEKREVVFVDADAVVALVHSSAPHSPRPVDVASALWVGTYGGGINILDSDGKRFTRLQSQRDDPTTVSSNNVLAIHVDRSGTVWVATSDRGVNRFDSERKQFVRYAREADDPSSLSSDNLRSIYEDKTGIPWIGTFGGGVNKLDRATTRFAHYRSKTGERTGLSNSLVLAVYVESKEIVGIGTEDGLESHLISFSCAVFKSHRSRPRSENSSSILLQTTEASRKTL